MNPEFTPHSEISGDEIDEGEYSQELENQHKDYSKLLRYSMLGVLGLMLIVGTVFGANNLTKTEPQTKKVAVARPIPVTTLRAEPVKSYQVLRTYTGEIAAIRTSELGFERGGKLVDVFVKEGDRITSGQSIAKLDVSNLQMQKLQLEAQLAQAQARLDEFTAGPRQQDITAARAAVEDAKQQLQLQKTKLKRRKYLYGEGAIAREQLDEIAFGENSLNARLQQAQSSLDELLAGTRIEQLAAQRAVVKQLEASISDLQINIAKSTIKAPFSGIISARQIDEGTVVNPGQAVVRLVENISPEARIGMPTTVVNKLRVGSSQTVEINNQTTAARVASILPVVNPSTRTQVVVLKLESSTISQINPGQTVRLKLTDTIPTEGFWLPNKALTQGLRGLWTSYVLTKPKTENSNTNQDAFVLEQRSIEILHQESDRVLVRGTLQPGDMIVADGIHRLVPGQIVRPIGE
ncbi:efflux RND transporter periplasmic adaptor subunit [Rivularia sp. UHCC 0363]|uniref:efflux RND transporter periplasmic adaptor subunit n=1 Tax=Rivularia sp. UHCC 0363 TaxID=3110244 RepID=UPI002B205399|nr:efflux RND transporter periplasmic adaptor subunit [Rivularia sp. UHCC 0363]MEA5593342.1 efflux RND transporter periplasmic adaptor subunit [Rivularia sp. UHCC 0363]